MLARFERCQCDRVTRPSLVNKQVKYSTAKCKHFLAVLLCFAKISREIYVEKYKEFNLALEKELEQKQASPDKTTGQETNDKQHISGTSTSECSSEGESNSNSNPTGIIIEFRNTSKVCGDSIHLNQLTNWSLYILVYTRFFFTLSTLLFIDSL